MPGAAAEAEQNPPFFWLGGTTSLSLRGKFSTKGPRLSRPDSGHIAWYYSAEWRGADLENKGRSIFRSAERYGAPCLISCWADSSSTSIPGRWRSSWTDSNGHDLKQYILKGRQGDSSTKTSEAIVLTMHRTTLFFKGEKTGCMYSDASLDVIGILNLEKDGIWYKEGNQTLWALLANTSPVW